MTKLLPNKLCKTFMNLVKTNHTSVDVLLGSTALKQISAIFLFPLMKLV